MRRATMIISLLVATLVASHQFLNGTDSPARSSQTVKHEFDERSSELERSLAQSQRLHAEQIEQLTSTQSELHSVIVDLNTQLRTLVAAQNKQQAPATIMSEDAPDIDAGTAERQQQDAKPEPPSEAQVGQLMDDAFMRGDWDMGATELARSQATEVVAALPGVNLADMVCNEGLCRATFIKLDGGVPQIGDIWGQPPFMNDGFTVNNDDGSVVLYYAQAGVSLNELREQLLADN